MAKTSKKIIHAVDLFCGVGGLSWGLKVSGVNVVAGYDIDESCRFAYEKNLAAKFFAKDIASVTGAEIRAHYPKSGLRLLAGCAPCQPFSRHMRGVDTKEDAKWGLLDEFSRLVEEVGPDLVTMENVTGLLRTDVFQRFTDKLKQLGYSYTYRSCHGPKFGLAQHRRRLVLMASRIGEIPPLPDTDSDGSVTVRHVIAGLPALEAGQECGSDKLHKARALTEINLRRIRASRPGGTWHDWPDELRAPCHTRDSGASFQSVYARMSWDEPSPTITTQSYNFGTGRFGHPEQDRAITLREAAMLQGFPLSYQFMPKDESPHFLVIGKHIGNAVPPPLGEAVGRHFVKTFL